MTSKVCPGPCNRQARRAWAAYEKARQEWLAAVEAYTALREAQRQQQAAVIPPEPQPPAQTPNPGDPIWCGRCVATVRRALIETDRLAAIAEAQADGHRSLPTDEIVTRSPAGSRSPSTIAETLDQWYGELADAEDEYRQWRCHAPVYRGKARGAQARAVTVAYLAGHLTDVLSAPEFEAFGHRALSWEMLLRGLTKSEAQVRGRPGRCPRCRRVNLLQLDADGMTKCRGCGYWMHEQEYGRDVLEGRDEAVVRDSRRPVP